jgi:hypothetical protein
MIACREASFAVCRGRRMLFQLSCFACLLIVLTSAVQAHAQRNAPAHSSSDRIADYVRGAFQRNQTLLLRAVESMPGDGYKVAIGTSPESRTFAQLVGNLINMNFLFCARGKGEANPAKENYEAPHNKQDLVGALQSAFDYCHAVYESLTDSSVFEIVQRAAKNGGSASEYVRVHPLLQNVIHNHEQYGMIVVYLRLKGLPFPSSAARSAPE